MKVQQIKDQLNYYSRHNLLFQHYLRQIAALDALAEPELNDLTASFLTEFIDQARSKSVYYAGLYRDMDAKNLIYQELPILYKADIRNNSDQIRTKPFSFYKKAFTSGTSGTPLVLYRTWPAIVKENAYLWHFRMKHGLKPGEPVVSLRGVLNNDKLYYFNKAENILYLSSYLLSPQNAPQYINLLKEFRPKAIWAYPSAVYSLVNILERINSAIKIPLVFTSSETLYYYQRNKVADFLGAKIYDWYGNAERTIAIGQCEYGVYHEMPLYGYNEFIEDGIITTSFINKDFPLIKYFVDDKIVKDNSACKCGKQTCIKEIGGRADDVVTLADKTEIGRMDTAFKGVNHVLFAQIIQTEVGRIKVHLVEADDFTDTDKQLLLKNLRARLNDTIQIDFRKIEEAELIKSKSGKFKLVISEINKS